MVYYKNRKWNLSNYKIKYIQHNEEIEQYVGSEGKEWWIDFVEKWEHTEVIEFIDTVASAGQLKRLEEINQLGVGDGFGDVVSEYIESGTFPEEPYHILTNLQIKKEQELQDNYLLDLDYRQSIVELGV